MPTSPDSHSEETIMMSASATMVNTAIIPLDQERRKPLRVCQDQNIRESQMQKSYIEQNLDLIRKKRLDLKSRAIGYFFTSKLQTSRSSISGWL
jgi:hypothetical protein